ncbi:unnamed protein product [Ostreobium quekettii]|uniref:Alpha N-terminal protein methyltransferase 1 n=1 Tax=Ostreobium quekettii TaxID=121088 RepID=A0A8S1JA28_9CHLO|nr:unnamed protein product [Ostreobium quekettii]
MEENGIDTEGQEYPSAQAFWEAELSGEGPSAWYSKALKYWDQQEPTYNGVLAGYGHLSRIDLIDSAAFLKRVFAQLFKERRHEGATTRSVDCGAGVGRVSEHVLLHAFDEVDLLEPSKPLLEEARQRLAVPKAGEPLGKATKFICTGLQDFEPEARRYDCIWLQWVILCITDDGVVNALTRCKDGLRDGGYIIVRARVHVCIFCPENAVVCIAPILRAFLATCQL